MNHPFISVIIPTYNEEKKLPSLLASLRSVDYPKQKIEYLVVDGYSTDATVALAKKFGDKIRVYPGSMEVRDGKNYALKSRAIGVLGIGDSIEEARQISQEGAKAITGGALWNRTDVASKQHIAKSVNHMEQLRHKV